MQCVLILDYKCVIHAGNKSPFTVNMPLKRITSWMALLRKVPITASDQVAKGAHGFSPLRLNWSELLKPATSMLWTMSTLMWFIRKTMYKRIEGMESQSKTNEMSLINTFWGILFAGYHSLQEASLSAFWQIFAFYDFILPPKEGIRNFIDCETKRFLCSLKEFSFQKLWRHLSYQIQWSLRKAESCWVWSPCL